MEPNNVHVAVAQLADYTHQFLQIPRSFVKILGGSFCTIEEQNSLPLKRNFNIVSMVKLQRVARL